MYKLSIQTYNRIKNNFIKKFNDESITDYINSLETTKTDTIKKYHFLKNILNNDISELIRLTVLSENIFCFYTLSYLAEFVIDGNKKYVELLLLYGADPNYE